MTVTEAPAVYCFFNDVGRVSWIENLTATHPTGDCDGPLLKLLGRHIHLCERHLLQAELPGAYVRKTTEAGGEGS